MAAAIRRATENMGGTARACNSATITHAAAIANIAVTETHV